MSTNPYYLSSGSHAHAEDGRCAMEWVAFLAGEPHTDQPVCVDPPLRSFCIRLNDVLGDEDRQKLRPYLARCIGTAGDGHTGERGYLCLDWIVRTYTPTWLELTDMAEDGARLRALAPITDLAAAKAAGPVVRGARQKAAAAGAAARAAARAAAWDAAWAAAWDAAGAAARAAARDAAGAAAWAAAGAAAWDAAWDAAWAAAWAAAWDAAGAAAWDAAGAAAWDAAGAAARAAARDAAGAAAWAAAGAAAWDAAGAALAPTVKVLQASAFDLLDRMLPKVMLDVPAGVERRVDAMEAVAR